jgi:hypothetical protein
MIDDRKRTVIMTTTMSAIVGLGGLGGLAGLGGLVGLAGCGSGPSCEKAMANAGELRKLDDGEVALSVKRCKQEGWSSAMRGCIADADDDEELAACAAKSRRRTPSGSYESYMEKSKRSEAELQLRYLERAIKTAYAEEAQFPVADAPLTPSSPCCEGPGHKCQPSSSAWNGQPAWDALDFELTEPGYFQYSYHGSATEAVAEAVGDLDCDNLTVTYTLRCTVTDDAPTCELSRPERED